MSERNPHRLLFDQSSAQVLSTELYPSYTSTGALKCAEAVPFRLTRNLHTLVEPFRLDGVFASAMASMAECMLDSSEVGGQTG